MWYEYKTKLKKKRRLISLRASCHLFYFLIVFTTGEKVPSSSEPPVLPHSRPRWASRAFLRILCSQVWPVGDRGCWWWQLLVSRTSRLPTPDDNRGLLQRITGRTFINGCFLKCQPAMSTKRRQYKWIRILEDHVLIGQTFSATEWSFLSSILRSFGMRFPLTDYRHLSEYNDIHLVR